MWTRSRDERGHSAVAAAVLVVLALLVGGYVAYDMTQNPAPTSAARDLPVSSASPSPTVEPQRPEAALGGTGTLKPLRQMIASAKPLVISVLGDSTGNEPTEWVNLWAEHLAETRAVTLHVWDDATRSWLDPEVKSQDGSTTEIWNMSSPGQKLSYPASIMEQGQPVEPDMVIYNFGHNNTAENFGPQLFATMNAVSDVWGHPVPSVLTLQNPSRGDFQAQQEETIRAIRGDTAPLFDIATIDVFAAFEAAPNVRALLMEDKLHPAPEGSQVWADVVIDALG